MRCLAILLFHNDEDLIEDQIEHMTNNKHDLIIIDHCSTDNSRDIITRHSSDINVTEILFLSEEISFCNNKIFEYISIYVYKKYSSIYDWFTFVESDEFLEGPDRTKNFYQHLIDVYNSNYDCVNFDNILFWYTDKDDQTLSCRKRIKYYNYKPAPAKYYSWRASIFTIRIYNHNAIGKIYPINFKTCHYEYRSSQLAVKKLTDRFSKWTEDTPKFTNYHYKYMLDRVLKYGIQLFEVDSSNLHYDNGGELDMTITWDFKHIYDDDAMVTEWHKYEKEFINEICFSKFKNIYSKEKCILMGSGESLNKFIPKLNNLHNYYRVGVNGVILHHEIRKLLDIYIWAGDIDTPCHPQPMANKIIESSLLLNKKVTKFCCCYTNNSLYYPGFPEPTQIEPNIAEKYGFHIYNQTAPKQWNPDICKYGLDCNSVAFQALQILLFMGFEEIILVGFDCGIGKHSYSYMYENDVCDWSSDKGFNDVLIELWLEFKDFVKRYYPNVSLKVVNPLGLTTIFEEIKIE